MEDYYQNSYPQYYSSQSMIDRQKQSLKYSYETLGNLLSAAENFAGFANEQYGSFNISSSSNYKDLKSEFIWELKCFKIAKDKYQNSFQTSYQFPPDCSKDKILRDIQRYIQNTKNKEDQLLFYSMADIINGKQVNLDYNKLFMELDKNAEKKINPKKLANIVGPLNYHLDQIENEADKGNMNLFPNGEDITDKTRKKLKIESEKMKSTKYVALIGKRGKFIKNIFIASNNYQYEIQIDSKITKTNSIYSFNHGMGIIYILNNNKNYYDSILFDIGENKEIDEDDIAFSQKLTLNKRNYLYGKTNKYDVLVEIDDVK